jgi:hypothetical protein
MMGKPAAIVSSSVPAFSSPPTKSLKLLGHQLRGVIRERTSPMIGLTPWHIVITLSVLLIIIAVIVFTLVMIIQYALGGWRPGSGTVHADLIRIDERLSAIEKSLRDIR